VLTNWQKTVKGPITYTELAGRWANTRTYGTQIAGVATRFFEEHCRKADPHPELLAEVRGAVVAAVPEPKADVKSEAKAEKISGAELAQKAIADGKAEQENRRFALGGVGLTKAPPSIKILNGPSDDAATAAEPVPAAAAAAPPAVRSTPSKPQAQPASAPAAAAASKPAPPAVKPEPTPTRCRVWTASYGGGRALIIRSVQDGMANFTVLDVNEGHERREAEAYITAYAKGGTIAGEFASQNQALEKAFELCPEG
jgi:hypothetical protein